MLLVYSAEDSGRVLKYDPSTKQTTVLLRNLQFPNGLSLSKDRSFFVFCEGAKGRYIGKATKDSLSCSVVATFVFFSHDVS